MRTDTSSWQQYFADASNRAGYNTERRGWASELAAATGVTISVITRWRAGSIPQIDGCRALAAAWGVPILDVIIAAGILTVDEAQWKDRPTPEQQRLANVQAVLDDPNTPPALRDLMSTVLDGISHAATQIGPSEGPEPRP